MTNRRPIIGAAIGLAGASLGLSAQAAPEAAALLQRYVELKNAHDATRCGELFLDDYVEHSGRNPSGLPALIANWEQQFAGIPDMRLTLEDQVIAGDKMVARMTYAGTYTRPFILSIQPNGRRFTFGTIDIWRLSGGKFAEHWDQVDFAGLARQLQAPG